METRDSSNFPSELENNFSKSDSEREEKVKVRYFRVKEVMEWGGMVIKRGLDDDDDVEYAFWSDPKEDLHEEVEKALKVLAY